METRDIVRQAGFLIYDHKAEEAYALLHPLVQSGQDNHEGVCYTFVRALIHLGKAAEGVTLLRPLIYPGALLEKSHGCQTIYAQALIEMGDPQAAIDHLRPLVASNALLSDNSLSHCIYIKALFADGEKRTAIEHVSWLHARDQTFANDIQSQRQYLRMLMDGCEYKQVIDHYSLLITAHKPFAGKLVGFYDSAMKSYVRILSQPENKDERLEPLKITVPVNESFLSSTHLDIVIGAHNSYAAALIDAGRSHDAITYLAPTIAAGGFLEKQPSTHIQYAQALMGNGRRKEALTHLKSILSVDALFEKNLYVHAAYIKMLATNGMNQEIIAHLKPLIAVGGILEKWGYGHAQYAYALTRMGRPVDAVAYLKPLLIQKGFFPNHAIAYSVCAAAEITIGNYDEGIKTIGQIPEPQRRDNPVLNYLEAKAHFLAGRVGETLKLIRSTTNDKHPALLTLYLACFQDQGEVIGVIKTILGPDFTRLWEKSRNLSRKSTELVEAERELFARNSLWEYGASPVDRMALKQMAEVPRHRRLARD